MPVGVSERILSVLQLTRMALVFTAIADSLASTMIWASWRAAQLDGSGNFAAYLSNPRLIAVALVSLGLYGFGMSLNDIIDRRRDLQIAAYRPLPSGRIGLIGAHVVCAFLGTVALGAGIYLAYFGHTGLMGLILLLGTLGLITFYDFAGKYLVWSGLLTLGFIRFFHATIPAPQLPLVWHPLLLLNHVALLSALAYSWEQKRPQLSRSHWWAVIGGLVLADVTCIALVYMRRQSEGLWITRGLIVPAEAVAAFVILAILIRKTSPDLPTAGKRLMLAGLLWLIVYDAAFVAGYVNMKAAMVILALLPIAYTAVMMMRWWSKLILLSQKPEYQRAR
ncbi:MAG TPA: hypothetical protein VHD56_17225 [Tepidisphaeraceae bacterium]|nr:hypothetical protein [Tepidisphaeraceae bacterium]